MTERNGHGVRTLIFGLAMALAAFFGRGWIERTDRNTIEITGDYRALSTEIAMMRKDLALVEQREKLHYDELNRKLEVLLDMGALRNRQ